MPLMPRLAGTGSSPYTAAAGLGGGRERDVLALDDEVRIVEEGVCGADDPGRRAGPDEVGLQQVLVSRMRPRCHVPTCRSRGASVVSITGAARSLVSEST